MAYAVAHGIDRVVNRPRSARECLELVKVLEAEAEPDILIFDAAGVEITLCELEKQQRQEVERAYVIRAPLAQAPYNAPRQSLRRAIGATNRGPITNVLMTAAATVLLIGAVWRYERPVSQFRIRHSESGPVREVAPASSRRMKTPQGPRIPAGPTTTNKAAVTQQPTQQTTSYMVAAGDSLWRISKRVYHDGSRWREIVAANPGLDPDRMRPGETIKLPQSIRAPSPR